MKIQLINEELVRSLHKVAKTSERLRINFDLRNSERDKSQRMLNVMEPGTKVPIHRHLDTSETVICLEGCLDWIFYSELPGMDAGIVTHDGETATVECSFKEVARFRVCPREHEYGIQVPMMVWHSVEVHEPSTILEAKDGMFMKR